MKNYKAEVKGLELYTNADNKKEARQFFKEIAKEQGLQLPASFKITEVECNN